MRNNHKFIIAVSLLALNFNVLAKENIGTLMRPTTTVDSRSIMAGCNPATAQTDLDINNVRAKIFTGGDMWWDLINNPKYFIPKPAKAEDIGPSSLFAGSLWIGGVDAGNQLKVAAQTYRQSGNDFWPGPLTSSATIDPATCVTWDKFWKVNRKDVEDYYNWFAVGGQVGPNPVSSSAMDVINTWPAVGPDGQPMAPYHDYNNDGAYDPSLGDYPDFDITGTKGCNAQLFGHQNIFWVFNDKGNVHTETGAEAIGLEIQAQAFAFQSTDEINNMTFYKYKIVNKSSFRMDSTYFGVWDDPDLGYYLDDHVGCDVELGLGIVYNAYDVDGTGQLTAYGANPPAVGVDFFEGPFADPDLQDNSPVGVPPSFLFYGDNVVDNERLGIGKFIYYNNDFTVTGNPSLAIHYYQYLMGIWKDGTPFTYGGDGHSGSIVCDYVFPDNTDPAGIGTGGIPQPPWTAAGTTPADKRFLESAGPFTLKPGAVNTITIGVPWARATQGGALASVALLKGADAKAQKLFNNCFATVDGPQAPNLVIQELDKELILTWSNPKGSNNYQEKYTEDYDKSTGADSLYRFQGYQIYQLKDDQVGQTELYDVSKARLVFQCDIKDGVSQIVNYKNNLLISALEPQEMVDGENKGIVHSVRITNDKFATGDDRLINHKTYHYAIVAYGYSSTQRPTDLNKLQDYSPYIAGNRYSDAAFVHSAVPHIPSPESFGTHPHAAYESGPQLRRIEGRGNGGLVLDLTAGTEAEILASSTGRSLYPTYLNGRGPISVKVVDPLNVPGGSFRFSMYNTSEKLDVSDTAKWMLTNTGTNETVFSETTIRLPNEQLINGQNPGIAAPSIPRWGISVNVNYVTEPGTATSVNNGFIEATMTFADDTKQWLTGVGDVDGITQDNWIRSGKYTDANFPQFQDYTINAGKDDAQVYEKVLGGTWAPYRLAAYTTTGGSSSYRGGPAWNHSPAMTLNYLDNLASVDVVITSDKSKWTRCPVLEMQEDPLLAIGGATKLNMRKSPSVDKNGNPAAANSGSSTNPADPNYIGDTGMGWFPGYAINLETGERLNMAFGEDSWLANDNGGDMKWNPTSVEYSTLGPNPIFGGKHYIYVFGHNADTRFQATDPSMPGGLSEMPRYDAGKAAYDLLKVVEGLIPPTSDKYKRSVFKNAMWVNIPILETGHTLLETDVRIRLRVSKAYKKYGTGTPVNAGDSLVVGASYFVENGTVQFGTTIYGAGTSFVATQPQAGAQGMPYTVPPSSNPNPPLVLTTKNAGNPMYEFSTYDLETHKNDAETAKSALDLINVVPNPYYAYSSYEKSALDNVVKITNLPAKATVSIYTLNGTLIKRIKKDDGDASASVDWDLKNTARIPIASGLYIIHVDVPDVGEKVLKWFGVMRPIDLEGY